MKVYGNIAYRDLQYVEFFLLKPSDIEGKWKAG
jgi:hypothetical protein